MFSRRIWFLSLLLVLTACETTSPSDLSKTPDVWASGQPVIAPIEPGQPTLSYALPATRVPGSPELAPTPDAAHYQTGSARGPETYVVQPGDMLSAIAQRYGVSMDAIAQENGLANPDALEVGQVLTIPVAVPQAPGPAYKLIPDSELVYGPMSAMIDVEAFLRSKGGYLANYSEDVHGEIVSGAQIVTRIAQSYSVNPRLLLALLEYHLGWVTNPSPDPALGNNPFGYISDWYTGLYKQLAWAAIQLNSGTYRWRSADVTNWVLADGSVVPVDATINAGTAGVQNLFSQLDDYSSWLRDVSPGGFFDTYYLLFGYPFDYAIEPLVPATLVQPPLLLPFGADEIWSFTGGPHLAWDAGTPFGALDFAPPGEALGCVEVDYWITAVADGLVVRTGDGVVILDLDQDGNEGTGWVILYMHIESRERVQPGMVLRAGDHIGHPSCEGGISSGTHVHMARKFNGEWIPADGPTPFNLGGWVASGTGEEYVGTLTRNGVVVESFEGNSTINQIQR